MTSDKYCLVDFDRREFGTVVLMNVKLAMTEEQADALKKELIEMILRNERTLTLFKADNDLVKVERIEPCNTCGDACDESDMPTTPGTYQDITGEF